MNPLLDEEEEVDVEGGLPEPQAGQEGKTWNVEVYF